MRTIIRKNWPPLALAAAGTLPVTLIAGTTFGMDLRVLAITIGLPATIAIVVLAASHPDIRNLLARALIGGIIATTLYDLFRFGFLWTGLMDTDPIPHIGTALGLEPGWVFGYLWRYLGNGTGLALAFLALGLRGIRAGACYGLAVCGGLLTVLVISPHGEQTLFPLTPIAVLMATGGHIIYGAVLGFISTLQRPLPDTHELTLSLTGR